MGNRLAEREHTGAYRSWNAMRRRCQSPDYADYPNYGGRGIKVCEQWRKFSNFLADMGDRPPGMTLDRIDNNGNYEPGNCRWATHAQQRRNSRRCKLTFETAQSVVARVRSGQRHVDVAAEFNVSKSTVSMIMAGRNWPELTRGDQ